MFAGDISDRDVQGVWVRFLCDVYFLFCIINYRTLRTICIKIIRGKQEGSRDV